FPEELEFPDEAGYKEKSFNAFLWCESCNERFEMTVSDNPEYANAYDVGTRKDDYIEAANLVKSKWKAFWKNEFWSNFLKVSGVLSGMAAGIGVFVLVIFGLGSVIDSSSVPETSSGSSVGEKYGEELDEAALYSKVYDATVIEMKKETGNDDMNKYIIRIDIEGYDVLSVDSESLYMYLEEGDALKVKIGASDFIGKWLLGGEACYTIYKDDAVLTTLYGNWKGE
ncbi:MAG: hypothetical protein J6J86_04860, partial [Lachnospiraceae bacterium]|nr:hypothetical protein [Lachnospiraceae bacterium]